MNVEAQNKIQILVELQELLCVKARELQDLFLPDLGTNNPVIWANKLSKDELEEMREENGRAYAPWGAKEEHLLLAMDKAGLSLFVVSQALGRTETSILGKLKKLKDD